MHGTDRIRLKMGLGAFQGSLPGKAAGRGEGLVTRESDWPLEDPRPREAQGPAWPASTPSQGLSRALESPSAARAENAGRDPAPDSLGALRLLPLLRALRGLEPVTAVVGMAAKGKPVLLNLRNRATWDLLAQGPAGCGKSEMLRTLVVSLALTSRQSELQMLAVDFTGRELAVIEALPHACMGLATEPAQALEVLRWLADEIEWRLRRGTRRPDLLLVVDRLGRVAKEAGPELGASLDTICRHGMKAGVHILAAVRTSLSPGLAEIMRWAGMVRAAAAVEAPGDFSFRLGGAVTRAEVAWLSASDLNTAVDLVGARWRSPGRPARRGLEAA